MWFYYVFISYFHYVILLCVLLCFKIPFRNLSHVSIFIFIFSLVLVLFSYSYCSYLINFGFWAFLSKQPNWPSQGSNLVGPLLGLHDSFPLNPNLLLPNLIRTLPSPIPYKPTKATNTKQPTKAQETSTQIILWTSPIATQTLNLIPPTVAPLWPSRSHCPTCAAHPGTPTPPTMIETA